MVPVALAASFELVEDQGYQEVVEYVLSDWDNGAWREAGNLRVIAVLLLDEGMTFDSAPQRMTWGEVEMIPAE